jgi:hypothetical protein
MRSLKRTGSPTESGSKRRALKDQPAQINDLADEAISITDNLAASLSADNLEASNAFDYRAYALSGVVYTRKVNLIRHLNTVHNKHFYPCDVCGRKIFLALII